MKKVGIFLIVILTLNSNSLAQSWNIEELSSLIHWGSANDVAFRDGYAYVATGNVSDFWTLDVSNPENPVPTSYWSDFGGAYQVELRDQYAYVMTYASNDPNQPWVLTLYLNVFDLSDLAHPVALTKFVLTAYYFLPVMEFGPRYAYYCTFNLHILDLQNPTAPLSLGSYELNFATYSLETYGDYLYLLGFDYVGGSSQILILDVSDPANPVQVGTFYLPDNWDEGALLFQGTTCYLVTACGLMVLDCSNPVAPIEIARNEQITGRQIDLLGNIACVAPQWYSYDHQIKLVDISVPSEPQLVSTYELPGDVMGVELVEDYLLAANSLAGLRILDWSTPLTITEISTFAETWPVYDLALVDSLAFIAAGDSGLVIINV